MAPKRSPGLPPPYRDPALEWLIANGRLAMTSAGGYEILPAPVNSSAVPKTPLMAASSKARAKPALAITSGVGPATPVVLMKAVAKHPGRAAHPKAAINVDYDAAGDQHTTPTITASPTISFQSNQPTTITTSNSPSGSTSKSNPMRVDTLVKSSSGRSSKDKRRAMLGPQAKRLAGSLRSQPKTLDTGGRRAAPQYHKKRGDKSFALAIAADAELRSEAMDLYKKDMRSAGDTSGFNWITWLDLHRAWWSFEGGAIPDPLPPHHRQDRRGGMPSQGIWVQVRTKLYQFCERPAPLRGLPLGHHPRLGV